MQLAYSHNTTALNRPGTATAAASAQSSVGQQRWYPTGSVLLAHPSFSFVSPQPLFAANTRAQPNPAVAVVKVAILGRRHRCEDQLPVSASFSLSLSTSPLAHWPIELSPPTTRVPCVQATGHGQHSIRRLPVRPPTNERDTLLQNVATVRYTSSAATTVITYQTDVQMHPYHFECPALEFLPSPRR